MSVPVSAMESGAYNAFVRYQSTAVSMAEPAVWPPDEQGEVSLGPQTTIHQANSSFGYADPGVFPPAGGSPPDELTFATLHQRDATSWTWDVSQVDIDAMDECVLTLKLLDGSPQALGWIFGIQSVAGEVGSSPPNWSNTTLVSIAWIGGTFADLDDYGDIFTARATTWPWAPDPETDEPYLAGSINLLDFVTPIVSPNTYVDRLEIPLADWEYWLSTYDWVSLVFTAAVEPKPFWMWGDFNTFDDEGNPYVGRNWIPFSPAAFLFSGHPFNDVTISIVPLVTDIAIEAIVSMGGLAVRGSPTSVPMEPRDAAPPTTHAARRFRDAHR